jgi:hypothetical protein
MERWCETNAIGSLHGRCRVHRAEILRLRGSCTQAEEQALLACEELRPYLRRELGWPLHELGRIRLQRGDVAGAEDAALAAHRAGWDPQPVLALVRLAQGDATAAAASVRDALERPLGVPSKERPPDTDLQRAPLLAAQVEAEIAAGDLARARSAAEELDLVATRFASTALVAAAAHARGRVRVAGCDPAGAEESLAEAVRLWTEVGAPYEVARARLDLADVHAAGGSEHRADLERRAARALLDGLASPVPPSSPGEGPGAAIFRREGDYWTVVFAGRTVRVRDVQGMHHLARLLAEPGREHHVLDLVAGGTGRGRTAGEAAAPGAGDSGELLDATAKEAYRRRLAEIDEDIEDARTSGDDVRAARADAERDFLVRELARAFGLGGRARRAGSASERARAGVTRAVRQAIARIAEHHPELGEHLARTIRTGTYCAYLPDPRAPVGWTP